MKKLLFLPVVFVPCLSHALTGYEGFTVHDAYDPQIIDKCYYGPFTECCNLLEAKYGYDHKTLVKNNNHVIVCSYWAVACAAGYYGNWSSGNFYEHPNMGNVPTCKQCPESGFTVPMENLYITDCKKYMPSSSGSDSTGSYTYEEAQCSWVP